MTDATNDDWDERDRAARSELDDPKVTSFGSRTPRSDGKLDRPGTMVEVSRGGAPVGWVSVYEQSEEWLLETFRIHVFKEYRFNKALHEMGEYQPRWGMFLMEEVFAQFPDKEIRESQAVNDPPGFAFVKRVRGEYALPYHQPECFRAEEEQCVCGIGRRRSTTNL